jgi:RES domain-containing protein
MITKKLTPRSNDLIDAIEAQERKLVQKRVWRAVREGYDVLRASRAGGRWDDGTFDVLYTSTESDGAIAERYFHLSRGQPIIPSRPTYFVHEIEVSLSQALDLSDMTLLKKLGIDTARYGALSYIERHQEYPSTQQIAEIAHFLEFDGVIVPSARWSCSNIIVFSERTGPASMYTVGTPTRINWSQWSSRIGNRN